MHSRVIIDEFVLLNEEAGYSIDTVSHSLKIPTQLNILKWRLDYGV
jgi:hypothetical protein